MVFEFLSSSPPIWCTRLWLLTIHPNTPERPGSPQICSRTTTRLHLLFDSGARGRLAVDEEDPVGITTRSHFGPGDRTEQHHARVRRYAFLKQTLKRLAAQCCILLCSAYVSPFTTKAVLEVIDQGCTGGDHRGRSTNIRLVDSGVRLLADQSGAAARTTTYIRQGTACSRFLPDRSLTGQHRRICMVYTPPRHTGWASTLRLTGAGIIMQGQKHEQGLVHHGRRARDGRGYH